ncbi:MAG: helix-turn-helix domain-containing protein [Sediminibacterium sp.]
MNAQAITQRIKAIRIKKNLKQQSVARKAGLSLTGYSNIERGFTKNFTIESIINISLALEVSISEIIHFEDLPEPLQKLLESYINNNFQFVTKHK